MRHLMLVVATLLLVAGTLAAQAGCSWSPINVPFSVTGIIEAEQVHDDGSGPALFLGGRFAFISSGALRGVLKWDGTTTTVPGGAGLGLMVFALARFDDGTGPALYAGGSFPLVGQVGHGMARWDGSTWSPVGGGVTALPGQITQPEVFDLVVFDDGTGPALYAGGIFTLAGGVAANNVARWNGTFWSSLGVGVGQPSLGEHIRSLAVFDDGTGRALYAGGTFTTAGGQPAANLARWDGANWSPVAGGVAGVPSPAFLSPLVRSLLTFDDGTGPALYAGGEFATAGTGATAVNHNLARFDGVVWSDVGAATGLDQVLSLTVFDDGTGPKLFLGGSTNFSSFNAQGMVMRWDGASWSTLPVSGGPSVRSVDALAAYDSGSGPALLVGGQSTAALAPAPIASWVCPTGLSLSLTQPGGAGSPVNLANANLTPGHEYFNIFSFDLCPAGVGTGAVAGLCINTPVNFQFIASQLATPLGANPIHFRAQSDYLLSGPFNLPPLNVEAITVDLTAGILGPISPVSSISIQ